MLKESILLRPYSLDYSEESRTYSFTTTKNLHVEVYFTDGSRVFDTRLPFQKDVYYFGFNIKSIFPGENVHKSKGDPRLKDTIVYILYQHFGVNPDSIIIFTCDQTDGQQAARHRKFNAWYLINGDFEFEKIDKVISVAGYEHLDTMFSAIFSASNKYRSLIKTTLADFENLLDGKDYYINDTF